MELQFMLSARTFRNEILKDLENSELDPQFLKLIRENDELYKSFHDLFLQLKGTTYERIRLINEVLSYLREQRF
ncbi:MAG TPA: hypothetical protein VHI78_12105 [Bacteroidales bacterium]|jgi:hypothetical protein|nr:hypothetical protein [Bacteroidales bacterium]